MWAGTSVLVTGGASFIGSHLVDRLVALGAKVRVVDDLSSGRLENLSAHLDSRRVEFARADLRGPGAARDALEGIEVVFHLAADHGGRGYVDRHQAGPASNLGLDGVVFWHALQARVDKIVYASSGCVYPNSMQTDPDETRYLREDLVRAPYDADNMYGWAKLMGELTLRAYAAEHALKSASCRYFTVYGPRAVENHAIMAMIARAFIRQDPFEVWGDGTQVRNWTYIDDIVAGTILAAERIEDGSAVNLGTMERIRVLDAARAIMACANHRAEIRLRRDMPSGPLNRVADNALARDRLGWIPQMRFDEGIRRTIDWYFSTKNRDEVAAYLDERTLER